MQSKPTPIWRPISGLPLITHVIEEGLDTATEQYETLQQVEDRPHVLDDETVRRVTQVYSAQRDDLWYFEEQLARWQKETLTPAQRREIQRLEGQVHKTRETLDALLTLTEQCKQRMRDALLNKSDLQRELEALLQAAPPRRSTQQKRSSPRSAHEPPRQKECNPFRLPPEITMSKEALRDGWSYLFRHRTLGELGRIRVQDSQGQCYITCEVVGDANDPMTARRAEIFQPLGVELSHRIEAESRSGAVSGTVPPAPPSPPPTRK